MSRVELAVRLLAVLLVGLCVPEWISYDLDRAVLPPTGTAQEGGSFLVEGSGSAVATAGLAIVPLGLFVIAALAAPAGRAVAPLGVLALLALVLRFVVAPPDLGLGREVVQREPPLAVALAVLTAATGLAAVAASRRP
ncbi:hypothetical protein GKE82_03465 [Conexibacter sp. W3-3-2]|uniref:hypothetical protein n=1 Tax=Conexibacter sp. W3-3-2 TaxID=2675227 RepID=UPI0012BA17E9|nr:hypothetical protein [Conexibacter sp. W3-3-2]MTD43385.1 hypothetical protein [Conexibacter sp. W3-3-2]